MTRKKEQEPETPTGIARASERLKVAALEALSADRAKAAAANKLVAMGLALVCLAGGVDYFSHEDRIAAAITGYARDAGHADVASTVEDTRSSVASWKKRTLEKVPERYRDHLAGGVLALGLASLGVGLRMKVKAAGPSRGQVVRDVGRLIAGPGFVGIGIFLALSWRGSLVVRSALGGFVKRLWNGEMSRDDFWGYSSNYAPWAWTEVGGVLILGGILLGAAVGLRIAERRLRPRKLVSLEVVRRTAGWACFLSLLYYAGATFVAVASYGGALRVIAWPWKVDAGAFLVTLAFMALGIGLARTGTAEMRRQAKSEAAPEPA